MAFGSTINLGNGREPHISFLNPPASRDRQSTRRAFSVDLRCAGMRSSESCVSLMVADQAPYIPVDRRSVPLYLITYTVIFPKFTPDSGEPLYLQLMQRIRH